MVRTWFPHGPDGRVDAPLLAHPDRGYDLYAVVNGYRPERESGAWFGREARARLSFVNCGPLSKEGAKTLIEKLEIGLRVPATRLAMLAAARRIRPHVLLSTQNRPDIAAARFLAARLRLPHLVTLHYPPSRWLGRAALKALSLADCVVVFSDYMQRLAYAQGMRDVVRVYPYVPPYGQPPEGRAAARSRVRRELGITQEATVIGIGARIEEWKGQLDLVRAFNLLAAEKDGLYLLIAGEGGGEAALRSEVAQSSYRDRIFLCGWRPDIAAVYAAWDIAAHPSREEAFGLAVAEASRAGLPLVVYEDGAAPELVAHGETGLVVPLQPGTPPANVAGLSQALRVLAGDAALRARMGAAARERMSALLGDTPARAGAEFTAVVQRVLAQRAARRGEASRRSPVVN
jgi:glycosyltransferase involved in cell wall biosynthesis